jgi:hypothetical protein
MKSMSELYPNSDDFYDCKFGPMVNSFGNIVIEVDENDEQGSSWVLYNDNGRFGYLQFGWGSCAGCDSLKACTNIQEVQDLANELEQSIIWFDDKHSALSWFKLHDWEGDWSAPSPDRQKFTAAAIKYLENCE